MNDQDRDGQGQQQQYNYPNFIFHFEAPLRLPRSSALCIVGSAEARHKEHDYDHLCLTSQFILALTALN